MACTFTKIESFYRGDTKTYKFTVVDSDDVPVDITGWIFWFTLKQDLFDIDNAADQVALDLIVW